MILQGYITNYLRRASYEIIDGGKRFYGEIKELRGVWAVGKTLEECRDNLASALEGWLVLRLRKNLPIPNFKMPSRALRLKQYA